MSPNHKIKEQYTKKCGCNTCITYAEIIKYYCGCVKVVIYNNSQRCGQCTDFSGKRYTAPECR
jgi:hypothetical protein